MAEKIVDAPERARKPRTNLHPNRCIDLATRYAAGERATDLAAEFFITLTTAYRIIKRCGVPTQSVVPINHAAFADLTENAAYWIGMMMADGNIYNRRITLALKRSDGGHVEAFRTFLGTEHKIYKQMLGGVPVSVIKFVSPQIVADLAQYGVVPRKSLTAEVIGLEKNRDFWRGVVDGDGSLFFIAANRGWPRSPTVACAGSWKLMAQFARFCELHCPGQPVRLQSRGKFCQLAVGGQRAAIIAKVLYEGAETALERKRAIAAEIIATYRPNRRIRHIRAS